MARTHEQSFVEFACRLMTCLNTVLCKSTAGPRSASFHKERVWSNFHCSLSELRSIWNNYLKVIGEDLDVLVKQHVTQQLFEELLKTVFSMEESSDIDTSSSPNLDSDCTLSKDEENVIRYASGYVPMSMSGQDLQQVGFLPLALQRVPIT